MDAEILKYELNRRIGPNYDLEMARDYVLIRAGVSDIGPVTAMAVYKDNIIEAYILACDTTSRHNKREIRPRFTGEAEELMARMLAAKVSEASALVEAVLKEARPEIRSRLKELFGWEGLVFMPGYTITPREFRLKEAPLALMYANRIGLAIVEAYYEPHRGIVELVATPYTEARTRIFGPAEKILAVIEDWLAVALTRA